MSFPAQRGFHGSWSWNTAVRGNNRKSCCDKLETLRRLWCRSATNDEFHLRRDASIMWSRSYQVIARQNAPKTRTKSAGWWRWQGTRGFFTPSLYTVAFHFIPNQCQPSQSACGWEGYHVGFTIAIPANKTAAWLEGNTDKCGGGGAYQVVRNVEGVVLWNFLLLPQSSAVVYYVVFNNKWFISLQPLLSKYNIQHTK